MPNEAFNIINKCAEQHPEDIVVLYENLKQALIVNNNNKK